MPAKGLGMSTRQPSGLYEFVIRDSQDISSRTIADAVLFTGFHG